MKIRIVGVLLGLLALIINPAVGCSSSDGSWNFSEADMRAVVKGTYVGTYGNTTEAVTLKLDEATNSNSSATQSLSGRQLLQCLGRTFILPASACEAETSMYLTGQVFSSNGTISSASVSGNFDVTNPNLSDGFINLTLTDGSGSIVSAKFINGQITNWQFLPKGGTPVSLALVRQ